MDDESNIADAGEDCTFISKIIGEMKNKFNKTDKRQVPHLETEVSDDSNNLTETNDNSHSAADMSTEDTNNSNLEDNVQVKAEEIDVTEPTINPPSSNSETDQNVILFDINDNNKEVKQESEVSEDNNKPRIVMLFRKPAPTQSTKRRNSSEELIRRSLRGKAPEESEIKRSIRRRRSRDYGETVLQSAIARKEKSYNEDSKPQRSSRQLKPTPKILENLANAAAVKERNKLKASKLTEKQTETDSYKKCDENSTVIDTERIERRHKHKHQSNKSLKRTAKRFKSNTSDVSKSSDSDQNINETNSGLENGLGDLKNVSVKSEKYFTRSQSFSASCKEEDIGLNDVDTEAPEASLAEQESMYPADPECSSVGAELIASKLCLCCQPTQLYASATDSELFCMAVDNVGEKLVGCNSLVNSKTTSMLRPSNRIPYAVLCEVHRNRMLRHNCCPTCGVFCTQGTFVECTNKHQYHRECQIAVGSTECCPHCASPTPDHDVFITMYSSKKPVFLPKQRKSYPLAKITFHQNSYEEMKRSMSPILPVEALQFQFPTSPNYSEENCDIDVLFQAIKEENYEKLAFILGSKNVQLMTALNFDDCSTVLHYSAKNGLLLAVHMLVVAGMELDVLDKDQNTPLMVSVLAFKNDVVKYLTRAGASIIFKGTDGMTALHLAAECGNLEACELLIEAAIDKREYINCGDDGGWTSLVWACEHNHINIVQYLLRKGADPLLRDLKQNVALHWAAFSGCQEIVELLLKYGSDINVVNAQGDTPLHIGARQGNYTAVIILLIRGANVMINNKAGETPLHCTEQYSDCYNTILLNVQLQQNTIVKSAPIILTNDISRGRELNPIQCVNMVDEEPKPTDFIYISENCITSDVSIERKITSLQSCTCEDNCNTSNCQCANISITHWYDEDGRLSPDFNISDSPMIFECNQMCSCNVITCNNRVVQRGLSQRFELYRTEAKGWGIKALRLILKGSFVCEYIGEILSDVEADQREDDSYMFDLDNRGIDTYCIDAKHYGNLSRFINHSCDPNLIPVKVFIEHQDLRFPRIALFANRNILANEELCFDYGEKFWIVKYKSFTCECQSVNCKYSQGTIQTTLENYQLRLQEIPA